MTLSKKVSRNVYAVTFQVENMETIEAPERKRGEPEVPPQIKRSHGAEQTRLVLAYSPEGAQAFVRDAETVEDTARVLRCVATMVLANVEDIPSAQDEPMPDPNKTSTKAENRAEAKAERAELNDMTKQELVDQAGEKDGLDLNPNSTKKDLIHSITDARHDKKSA
jgi:hypothetical protein